MKSLRLVFFCLLLAPQTLLAQTAAPTDLEALAGAEDHSPKPTIADAKDSLNGEAYQQIRLQLSLPCHSPSKAELQQSSAQAEALLLALFQNENELSLTRERAILALALFSPEKQKSALEAFLRGPRQRRAKLLYAQALRLYSSLENASIEAFLPYLEDDDVDLRLIALVSLERQATRSAALALKRRLSKEKIHYVKLRLQESLDSLCEHRQLCLQEGEHDEPKD